MEKVWLAPSACVSHRPLAPGILSYGLSGLDRSQSSGQSSETGLSPQTVKILGELHPLPQTPAGSQSPAKLLQEIAWCEEMKERTGWGQGQVMGPVKDGHRRTYPKRLLNGGES